MKKYKPFFHKESGITFKDFQQVREYIWETREHKSEISGSPLLHPGHWQWHWQFLHLLDRNYTYWVLNPDNVMLGTVDEHDLQETFLEFRERKEKLKQQYYSENQIKKL